MASWSCRALVAVDTTSLVAFGQDGDQVGQALARPGAGLDDQVAAFWRMAAGHRLRHGRCGRPVLVGRQGAGGPFEGGVDPRVGHAGQATVPRPGRKASSMATHVGDPGRARRFGPSWGHETADLHRAPAGCFLRPAPRRRPLRRGGGLRRVLPLRPLPDDGQRRRPARADRRLDHPGRPGPRHLAHPVGHPRHLLHLPPAGAARHRRRPGRRHERGPGRAGPRGGLVRRRAPGLRHPVPRRGRALRPAGGAAGRHHRPVDDGDRRDVLFRRAATSRYRTARPCPSRSSCRTRR